MDQVNLMVCLLKRTLLVCKYRTHTCCVLQIGWCIGALGYTRRGTIHDTQCPYRDTLRYMIAIDKTVFSQSYDAIIANHDCQRIGNRYSYNT